jgi:3,4-dihydroxy 2-butanone 4-phosphate synthase/GTP cyclohydrolase II
MNSKDLTTRMQTAFDELRHGRMIILVDDDNREQEGDLVIAAEKITAESINFMTKHARGLLCLTLQEDALNRLNLPMMPTRNGGTNQAAFAASIDAAHGITTGISTHDRAHTILVAIDPMSNEEDISIPGHIFPLLAKQEGVLARQGHTEGSIDLLKLAGMQPAGAICEILNDDGTMARLPQLEKFAKQHQLQILSINDIIEYRLITEKIMDDNVDPSLNFAI